MWGLARLVDKYHCISFGDREFSLIVIIKNFNFVPFHHCPRNPCPNPPGWPLALHKLLLSYTADLIPLHRVNEANKTEGWGREG